MKKNNVKSRVILFVILTVLFVINQNIDYQNINNNEYVINFV
jgi:hypothetical protein